MDLDTAGAYERATQIMAETSQSRDGQEAMTAFIEKRRPEFDA